MEIITFSNKVTVKEIGEAMNPEDTTITNLEPEAMIIMDKDKTITRKEEGKTKDFIFQGTKETMTSKTSDIIILFISTHSFSEGFEALIGGK